MRTLLLPPLVPLVDPDTAAALEARRQELIDAEHARGRLFAIDVPVVREAA
jgi:hypothetical protein